MVAQGGSHPGHFVTLVLQVLTLFHAVARVDKACQKQGVTLRSLCKPCNMEGHNYWLMCVACLPYLRSQVHLHALSPVCSPELKLILLCEAPVVRCLQEKPSPLLSALV